MRKIAVIGAGHVGLITAAGFAKLGHPVMAVDQDKAKIETLRSGRIPFFEPGLPELLSEVIASGRLSFSTRIKDAAEFAEVIFICVGTPSRGDSGESDLSALEKVTAEIARNLSAYCLIVEKSTVPALTGEWVKHTLKTLGPEGASFDLAANPEFLREGSAVSDFFKPDRIVVGVESDRARGIMEEIYGSFSAPLLFTDIKSAELIKHASNSFLALKISYINAVSHICEKVGADVNLVSKGMGLDRRIGPGHLSAGIGYGGGCFPKDVASFMHLARSIGYDFKILSAAFQANQEQKQRALEKIKKGIWNLNGKIIGVLGLAFKDETDDIRESPALDIVRLLLNEGSRIKAYDPAAGANAVADCPEIMLCQNPYEVAEGADALLVLTEWPGFAELDFARIKSLLTAPVIFDGRNFLPREKLQSLGFTYLALGRP
ncbi:MAG: UDP-glucose/GDP-mannose dehydrogenase family protein [Candidatus Omnitrophica bacterium]|nr:UDP-glucose/GDP-mannose dehydrogenase family protein [Candidatus Omnitrophota bacterium]